MSRSYARRLFGIYSKKISTSTKIRTESTPLNNPRRSDINNGQNKRPVLGNNSKATCEKKCKIFNISHYPRSSQGLIPKDRTKQELPSSVIRTDVKLYVKEE